METFRVVSRLRIRPINHQYYQSSVITTIWLRLSSVLLIISRLRISWRLRCCRAPRWTGRWTLNARFPARASLWSGATRGCEWIHASTHACIHTSMHPCIYASMLPCIRHTGKRVRRHGGRRACMLARIHACMYIYTSACMYARAHSHTHTHTSIRTHVNRMHACMYACVHG